MLLSQPDQQRQFIVQQLLQRLGQSGAPQVLIDAFVPLLDNAVAEKAYEVIYQCRRKPG